MGVIFVTHDLSVAAESADDIAVMYAGRVVEQGTIRDIVRSPQHPYTRGLLEANVRPGQTERPLAIPGSPPNLANLPPGCSFAPRCAQVEDRCWASLPELQAVPDGVTDHLSRCPVTLASATNLSATATNGA